MFYRLENSTGYDVGQIYPQVEWHENGVARSSPLSPTRVDYRSFPDFDVKLPTFILNRRTMLTDLLSNSGGTVGTGLLISRRFFEILDSLNKPPIKYYQADVYFQSKYHKYLWAQILPVNNIIDFRNSIFEVYEIEKGLTGDLIPSSEAELASMRLNLEWPSELRIKFLKINNDCLKNIFDFFLFSDISEDIIISEKLRNILIENNITGIRITPLPNIE